MATRYGIIPLYDYRLQDYVKRYEPELLEGHEYALVELSGDKVVNVLGDDGCEPEDARLTRDFSWVLEAVNEGYRRGYKDGLERGRPRDALDMD